MVALVNPIHVAHWPWVSAANHANRNEMHITCAGVTFLGVYPASPHKGANIEHHYGSIKLAKHIHHVTACILQLCMWLSVALFGHVMTLVPVCIILFP